MEQLFRDFWWLMFPIFGMGFAVFTMMNVNWRGKEIMKLIKSYADQGKEPPPELLAALTRTMRDGGESEPKAAQGSSKGAWSFFVFLGIAAGCGVAYYYSGDFVFLAVGVTMAVLALGALVAIFLDRSKS